MERIVKSSMLKAIEALQASYENFLISENTKTIKINKSYFQEDYCQPNRITTCDEHKDIFNNLKSIKSPVLYWFELKNIEGLNREIRESFSEYRNERKGNYKHPSYRRTASYKKDFNEESNILYVGKVEKSFWRRVITHLGYAKSERTASMQLFHWYDIEKFGEIEIKYIVYENDMKYLVSVLEKELAKELKPLIGRY